MEVEVPRKSYCTELIMEDDKDTEKATKIENGSFLKANIFTITIPQASFTTSFLFIFIVSYHNLDSHISSFCAIRGIVSSD